MKKVLLIPDSFKGTMSSTEICSIMAERIRAHDPCAEILSLPVADGGEGSVDAFLAAAGGERVTLRVQGPYGEPVACCYGRIDGGATAVVEMAACAGLPLVGEDLRPDRASTFGVGQLIAHAVRGGCKKLIIALGGSATNDFGAGAAAALGVRFFSAAGEPFIPVGGTLAEIARIDRAGLLPELENVELITMCDIDNPLYGERGAACVFAPQKGADAAMVHFLDGQLRAVSDVVRRDLGVDVAGLPGAGAAGGMGGGMVAFLGARLQMGIETVLDALGFDRLVQGADLVFSGEGRLDTQSLRGKVVIGVARRCKAAGVPLVAVVGDIGDGIEPAYEQGVSAVFSINRVAKPFSEVRARSQSDLSLTMDSLLRLLALAKR